MTLPLFTKLGNLYSGATGNETKEAILNSIQTEVSRLIETRAPKRPDENRRINLLDYGVVDNVFLELTDEIEISRAQNYLGRLITHFEPRMKDVELEIKKIDASRVHVEISFSYFFDGKKEIANFTIDPSDIR